MKSLSSYQSMPSPSWIKAVSQSDMPCCPMDSYAKPPPTSSVTVAVRIRPLNREEDLCRNVKKNIIVEGRKVVLHEEKNPSYSPIRHGNCKSPPPASQEFVFDYVQDDSCHQSEADSSITERLQQTFYEGVAEDCVEAAKEGYNVTIFAYGQTGAGKTYTMMGDGTQEGRGIIPRLASAMIESRKASDNETTCRTTIEVSYLEIYREKIRDLLASSQERGPPLSPLRPGSPHTPRATTLDEELEDFDGENDSDGSFASDVGSPLRMLARESQTAEALKSPQGGAEYPSPSLLSRSAIDATGRWARSSSRTSPSHNTKDTTDRPRLSAILPELQTSPKGNLWLKRQSASMRSPISVKRLPGSPPRSPLSSPNSKAETLRVREHPKTGPYVQGLIQRQVLTWSEMEAIIKEGSTNRTMGATDMNLLSSRSHTIFTINMTQTIPGEHGQLSQLTSFINLVDLAGSERLARTNATGERLKESQAINLSLSLLNNVITQLSRGSGYIPYRDSALTWLLKESLGGNSKTVMIASISPSCQDVRETVSTLRYASRAKCIQNKPKINEDPRDQLIRKLTSEGKTLKAMLASLAEAGLPLMHPNAASAWRLRLADEVGIEVDIRERGHTSGTAQGMLSVVQASTSKDVAEAQATTPCSSWRATSLDSLLASPSKALPLALPSPPQLGCSPTSAKLTFPLSLPLSTHCDIFNSVVLAAHSRHQQDPNDLIQQRVDKVEEKISRSDSQAPPCLQTGSPIVTCKRQKSPLTSPVKTMNSPVGLKRMWDTLEDEASTQCTEENFQCPSKLGELEPPLDRAHPSCQGVTGWTSDRLNAIAEYRSLGYKSAEGNHKDDSWLGDTSVLAPLQCNIPETNRLVQMVTRKVGSLCQPLSEVALQDRSAGYPESLEGRIFGDKTEASSLSQLASEGEVNQERNSDPFQGSPQTAMGTMVGVMARGIAAKESQEASVVSPLSIPPLKRDDSEACRKFTASGKKALPGQKVRDRAGRESGGPRDTNGQGKSYGGLESLRQQARNRGGNIWLADRVRFCDNSIAVDWPAPFLLQMVPYHRADHQMSSCASNSKQGNSTADSISTESDGTMLRRGNCKEDSSEDEPATVVSFRQWQPQTAAEVKENTADEKTDCQPMVEQKAPGTDCSTEGDNIAPRMEATEPTVTRDSEAKEKVVEQPTQISQPEGQFTGDQAAGQGPSLGAQSKIMEEESAPPGRHKLCQEGQSSREGGKRWPIFRPRSVPCLWDIPESDQKAGWIAHFLQAGVTAIGSTKDADICIDGLKKEHCKLRFAQSPRQWSKADGKKWQSISPGKWSVSAMLIGGAIGTLNGEPMRSYTTLQTGDKLVLGDLSAGHGTVFIFLDPTQTLACARPSLPGLALSLQHGFPMMAHSNPSSPRDLFRTEGSPFSSRMSIHAQVAAAAVDLKSEQHTGKDAILLDGGRKLVLGTKSAAEVRWERLKMSSFLARARLAGSSKDHINSWLKAGSLQGTGNRNSDECGK